MDSDTNSDSENFFSILTILTATIAIGEKSELESKSGSINLNKP